MPHLRHRRRAVSLVEVILASAVLAVMMVPMLGMFQLGNRMGVAGERRVRALLFANRVVEQLRAEMDRWAANSKGTVGLPRLALSAPKGYTYGVTNQTVEAGLEQFTVTVRWNEGKRQRDLTLQTLVSRLGAQKTLFRDRRSSTNSPRRGTRRAGFQW